MEHSTVGANELDTRERVRESQYYAREPIPLDQTVGAESDSQRGDLLEDTEAGVALSAVSFTPRDWLQSALGTLSDREVGIIQLRLGLADGQPRTLDHIGHIYGITRERIRQIETNAMAKLRHPSRSQRLRAGPSARSERDQPERASE